jgi:hypothetical protein
LISTDAAVQNAAIWCIRNLTATDTPDGLAGVHERQQTMRSNATGLEQRLQDVAMQQKFDIKSHARSALLDLRTSWG